MPRFPKKEAEIVALAEQLWRGLWVNRPTYQRPPVHPILILIHSLQYRNRREFAIAKQAAAETAIAVKNYALDDLIEALKSNIRYAENTVNYDDDKLKLIGWAGKKAKTPLAPPGQVRLLEASKQGKGWVYLDWKAPARGLGGQVRTYVIERREQTEAGGEFGDWAQEGIALESEAAIMNQPRGVQLEYRIIAVNKAGDGEPSNTVMVVL